MDMDMSNDAPARDKTVFQRGGCYVFLATRAVLLIPVIVLIYSSADISKAKPCDLKAALELIFIEHIPHLCKYNAIKEYSKSVLAFGIIYLIINSIFFVSVLFLRLRLIDDKKYLWIIYGSLIIVALSFFVGGLAVCTEVFDKKEEDTRLGYHDLKTSMKSWLEDHFISDDLKSNDKITRGWNNFFIQYDCCALNEVTSTENDFDRTSWCLTFGSCQKTDSQLPRACCKDVTLDDYENAPSTCYRDVIPGSHRHSCMDQMKTLSRENIHESKVSMLIVPLIILIIKECIELVFASISFYWDWRNYNTR